MTDTARSLTNIQTLFADNTSGAISPQDLRDFVQSVATPLEGEGFLGAGSYYRASFWAIASAAVTLPAHPTSFGTSVVAPWGVNRPGGSEVTRGRDVLSDSYSLDAADPTNGYGTDIDAGNAFMLEPGVWWAEGYVSTSVAMTGVPPVTAYFDQATWNPDFAGAVDGTAPFIHEGWYGPVISTTGYPFANVATGNYVSVTQNNIVVNDTDEAQPYILALYTLPGQTTDMTTSFYGVTFYKLS